MKRFALNQVLLSRLLVCLLVAGLAVQWMTNAVGMGSRGAGIVQVTSLDDVADRILIDLVASVCSKDTANGAQAKVDHCQHCVPVTLQFLAAPGDEGTLRLTVAGPVEPPSQSQVLPASRRQPGDGPSRAPPSIA